MSVKLKSKPTEAPASVFSGGSGGYAVARQPILKLNEQVIGYELLFREGIENCFPVSGDVERASRCVLNSSFLEGFDVLCDGRFGFVNCTREVLLDEIVSLLPPDRTAVEVLETVTSDKQIAACCRSLKDAGYLIALDDYVIDDPRESLVELADIIKVDIRITTPLEMAAMEKKYRKARCQFLAEKVENREEYAVYKNMGCVYFQGYFFRKPEMQMSRKIPANRLNYVHLLQAASRVEIDLREIEAILKREPSLCYSLLRYLNSPTFGFRRGITSVRHALLLLGEKDTRRWMRLVAMMAAGQDKPSDLILTVLVRARFCELIAPYIRGSEPDLFMLGLMSLIDALLEVPMEQVLKTVPLNDEIQETLLGKPTGLTALYTMMLAQESGDWARIGKIAKEMRLDEQEVGQKYWEATHWAWQVSHGQ